MSEASPAPASRRTSALVEVLLAVIAWGVSFIATKVALRDVSPVTIVWLRFTVGMSCSLENNCSDSRPMSRTTNVAIGSMEPLA